MKTVKKALRRTAALVIGFVLIVVALFAIGATLVVDHYQTHTIVKTTTCYSDTHKCTTQTTQK